MIGELIPARIDFATAGPDLWSRYHELRRLRHAERRPDDPLEPDDVVEAVLKKPNPFEHHVYYEISRDGVMLSLFHGETVTPANPEYETNRQFFWADAFVRPDQRRRGIATLWLPVAVAEMAGLGCTVVGAGAEADAGHGFLKWAGAEPKMTEIESRLRLSEVDWTMLERWTAEGARRSPETRLETYDGGIPREMWADYAPQLSALLNTMPFEGLEHGDIVTTPEQFAEWYERMAMAGEVEHAVITREPNGVISGITDLTWAPHRPRLLYQQFTGVRPDARGRGLGKWIKAAMLLHVRELYPDLEWIATGNAQSNAPMLKINRTIGFKPYRTQVEYQMSRAGLEARISSL